MTNEEILRKAIGKAEKKGYEVPPEISCEYKVDGASVEWVKSDIIFSHSFAKAFWNKQGVHTASFPSWKFHLQQMVLEEEPLRYLEGFLSEKGG